MRANSFRDLEVWQQAHKLVLAIYKASQHFPDGERFGLTSQLRRAAVSIAANIAEGFRRRGVQDKLRFYNNAEGSLAEVQCYLVLAHDLGYLVDQTELAESAEIVGRLLFRFIEATEVRSQTARQRLADS